MRNSNPAYTGFRNNHLFCYNCGQSYEINYPQPVSMAAALMRQFDKDHRNCKKTWEQPVADQSWPLDVRADWWKEGMNSDRGMSSEAMWECLLYRNLRENPNTSHPYDPADFRRCHLLLETIPEWRGKLDKLKQLSPQWEILVDNWDKLTTMLLEQMAGKKNVMYKFMQEILSTKQNG